MWHRSITHSSLESTRVTSWITGAELEGKENGEENVEVSETKYLRRAWLTVAGKRSASWAQHVVKGSLISSVVLTRSNFLMLTCT